MTECNAQTTLLPREGEKVAAKRSDEGASRRFAATSDFILNLAPSSVDFVDTFSPSRGRRDEISRSKLQCVTYAVSRRFGAFTRGVDGAFLPRPMRLARSERAWA